MKQSQYYMLSSITFLILAQVADYHPLAVVALLCAALNGIIGIVSAFTEV